MLVPAYQTPGDGKGSLRDLNYRICTAIDLTEITSVLRDMVKEGMDPDVAGIFLAQADVLVASLRTENNRLKLIKRK
jgi:hypothetical protein